MEVSEERPRGGQTRFRSQNLLTGSRVMTVTTATLILYWCSDSMFSSQYSTGVGWQMHFSLD